MSKKKYIILGTIICFEIEMLSLMKASGIQIHNFLLESIVLFFTLLPILILIRIISVDEVFKESTRKIFGFAFYFILFCYIVGEIVEVCSRLF